MQPVEPRSPQVSPDDSRFRVVLEELSSRLRDAYARDGVGPIEQLVKEGPEEFQDRIFEELLIEEARVRRVNGEIPKVEDYLQRFPDKAILVERVWHRVDHFELDSTAKINRDPSDAFFSEASTDLSPKMVGPDEPTVFGPYKVLRSLGSGTFGSVYKAQHESSGKVVAVKMLKNRWASDPECGKAMRRQFAEEAKMMLQFDHPNVVKIISLDDRANPPYFVQEFIDGETLANRLQSAKLSIDQALHYAIQIVAGLAHIHSRERWHRDLKPANILLDRNNHVYLADFGLALDDAQRWSSSRGPAGTYPYMAPEQIKGATHRLNARCDIWALGVILYEMLTGRRPFRGENRDQLRDEIIERTPAAPRELDRSIPRELNRLCMQCLSKKDADRPHAAADLQDDLVQILERLVEGSSSTSDASTRPVAMDAAGSTEPMQKVEYPIPTLKRFTADQAELYLRLMPRGYATKDELPELIAYWKQRILERDPDKTCAVGIMVGVSGCGKSSMLEAGLVPALPESVIPILIEASENDTEVRILNKLRRAIPEADPEKKWSLVDWAFRLRTGNLLPPDKKVVFILDQFEQWLNAHGGEPTNHLLDALHQSDGEHLQTIVCVREGFHATLMRFVQALSFKLDEERNYATAHRFTQDHARFVLSQFGRGLNRVENPISEAQRTFFDAAVEGLAESDRGVVCVRLVVLAMVMQDRSWTVEELESLGGLDGIGTQFLVDCFEGRTASEQYRRYLPAAMRVLAELLPAEGLEIKDVRSYEQLLAASELDKLQFDDLLNILTRKLFLLTLVEADIGSVVSDTSNSPPATSNFYQLTHDFLVPSIREWLAVKERQTRAGRARLKLAERTAAWRAKREQKQLPTPLETATIYWRTDPGRWTQDQREMMRTAVKHHGTLWGTVAVLLLVVGITLRTWQSQRELELQREQLRVAAESLQNNLGPSIPVNIRELKKLPESLVHGELVERFATDNPRHKLALAFALSAYGRPDAEYLISRIDDISVVDTANFVDALSVDREQALAKIKAAANECRSNALWRRKARLAIAALALGEAGIASDMCQYENRPDPGQRTIFIHEFPQWEWHLAKRTLDLVQVTGQVAETQESGLRSGLCLAVGSIPKNRVLDVNPKAVESWSQLASRWYAEHPDTSTHSAARWLLQRWEVPLPDVPHHDQIRSDRDWFVNSAGMTMLRIKPPVSRPEPEIKLTDPIERFRQQIVELQELPPEQLKSSLRLSRAIAHYQTANYSAALADLESLKEGSADSNTSDVQTYHILSLARLGRLDEATAAFESVRETLGENANLYLASQLASLRGDQLSALELLNKAFRDESLDDGELYAAACAAALCANSVSETDRDYFQSFQRLALDLLYKSINSGYSNGHHLSEDPDLAVLHGEPEFSSLVDKIYHEPAMPKTEYWIASCEVTRGQFEAFVRDTDYTYEKPTDWEGVDEEVSPTFDHPAQNVSWYDAVMYCNWLSRREGKTPAYRRTGKKEKGSLDYVEFDEWELVPSAGGYRLPLEAEWEFAARAGSNTDWSSGSDELLLVDYCQMHPAKQASVVGIKLPNAWGTHDMHGNVWEWCNDLFSDRPSRLGVRVFRGIRCGNWNSSAAGCGSAIRERLPPGWRIRPNGLRLAFSVSTSQEPVRKEVGGGALDQGTEGVAAQPPEMP